MEKEIKNIVQNNLKNDFVNQRYIFKNRYKISENAVDHYLEFVAEIGDVIFINDSKSCDMISTWNSIERLEEPIIWIAGGVSKGNDYNQMKTMVKDKVVAIIAMGEEEVELLKHFHKEVSVIINAQNLSEAVKSANKIAQAGQYVLFSPACPSYDKYQNYEQRGAMFKAEVYKQYWGGI
jgi:UDP-N-acetylmuramoylalanine--D-glutamate ligase